MTMKSYGVLTLTESSPYIPPSEPMTLTEAKELIRVTWNDENALISSMIRAARVSAEKELGFNLAVKQFDLTLDHLGPYSEIDLSGPLQSVDLFQYKTNDGVVHVMVEDTEYIVDKKRNLVCPLFGAIWPYFTPWPSGAVLIRHRAGYPNDHPFWSNDGNGAMMGMRFLVNDWWSNRDVFVAGGGLELPYRVKYLFGLTAKARMR